LDGPELEWGVLRHQVAGDTGHHLIITHEVTNVGTDRCRLTQVAKETK
jgi:hypothetical protein